MSEGELAVARAEPGTELQPPFSCSSGPLRSGEPGRLRSAGPLVMSTGTEAMSGACALH